MFVGHDPYLVALSVTIAILGGYTGFGLAARIRRRPDAENRILLTCAAVFVATGIWTMHFIGMLAAPLPTAAIYLVLPTVVSFLICALVVGVSLFFVSMGDPSHTRILVAAMLLGLGIASMHYVGMHGLAGPFAMQHDVAFVLLSVLIAVGAAYGGLRVFVAAPHGIQLLSCAAAFGVAVSGMHYTAMFGVRFVPGAEAHHQMSGIAASQQTLSLVVAVLCFIVTAGFLLSLIPDPKRHTAVDAAQGQTPSADRTSTSADHPFSENVRIPPEQTVQAPVARLPVEGAGGMHFVASGEVRSIRADGPLHACS